MKLSEELQWRGFVNQTTFKDLSDLDESPRTYYWGVDPSASSMTIGNYAAAMMAKVFLRHGWKAVLLVGGATGMIGDPDGKKQERDLKSLEQIEINKKGIEIQYNQVFEGRDFQMVDNHDWFSGINYLDFLREVGKHVSITQMLDRSFVQDRIGEGGAGISYAEFSYSLIQGYDFVHLNREYGVTVQLCGADQWGNSIAGVDLIRRMSGNEAHVYSCPLIINKSTGKKFGKSEDGAVWLDPEMTSVYKYYQFWLNVDDEGAMDYIKIYTEISPEDFDQLKTDFDNDRASRLAQKYLAYESTKLVHGRFAADSAKAATEVLFGGEDFSNLDEEAISMLAEELPTAAVGSDLITALVDSGVCASNGESRRLVQQGAISINSEKVKEVNTILDKPGLIKKGKNTFVLVRN